MNVILTKKKKNKQPENYKFCVKWTAMSKMKKEN